ncbi:MAG: SDR family NAD(P)-dependent oxidoreductase [Prevotellaceae bacterium]|nr:SDR family NAD(P)-dependent oxidoreductase [Prevotellaceae bacterium]
MKKVIIIGATSGIGRGLAEIYKNQGYMVGITGRRVELLDQLCASSPSFVKKEMDVTDMESVVSQLEELTAELGGFDLIIISSGVGEINESLDFDIEKRTIDTNVAGFTRVCDWAFNRCVEQQSGHLVGISSIAALRGNRYAPAYFASKAYQMNYLEGLRQKARSLKKPIFITDIRPGFVDTALAKGENVFWAAPVEKAAKQIYSAICRKKKTAYITKRWRLVAVLLRLLPKMIYDRV